METNDIKTHLMSDDIRQLAQAFLQAKMLMGGAKKNSKSNLHKYANLGAVYDAVEESLHQHNIFIWHFADRLDDGELVLHTRLIHAPTGQFVQDTRVLKSEKPGNQGMGSANTYMRRYAVLSLCALETEDDDGEEERKYIEKHGPKKEYAAPVNDVPITQQHITELQSLIKAHPEATALWSKIKSYNNISDLHELTEHQYNGIMKNTFKR
jgi:hypothetical protein